MLGIIRSPPWIFKAGAPNYIYAHLPDGPVHHLPGLQHCLAETHKLQRLHYLGVIYAHFQYTDSGSMSGLPPSSVRIIIISIPAESHELIIWESYEDLGCSDCLVDGWRFGALTQYRAESLSRHN